MIDTQAPEPPTKIASRPIAGGRLEVSWNPSVSDDVAKYNIYWDNGTGEGVSYSKPIATVTANSYQSSELQDGRNYEFSVRAEDRAGNEEKNTITSTSVPDNQPPTISHKPIIALLEQEIMTVTVYANVDDSSGLGKVKVHYRKHGDQQYLDRDMSNDGGNLYKGEIPSSVFSSAGVDYYISAMDLAGNTATTEVTKIAIVKSLQIAIDPSKENEITLGDGSSLYFPAGSVPLDTHLNISIPKIIPEPQSGLNRHILSREFSLDKELLKPINITLKYNDSNIIGEDESRLCMYLWDGKRWNYMANVDAQDNSATVSTMKWGIFSIIGDYEAPIIEELAPSEYAIPDSRITARIKDNGSGVIWKNIEIKLNGSKIEVPEASLREVNLSVAIPQKLTNGKYSLIIVVKDNAGNQSISESRFDVTGRLNLMNVYCYPNPFSPSIGTNFAYTLTESANEVNIRIFGMDGKLVRKIEGTIAVGKNIVSWSGDDELGDTVLNSVYICYIEVKGSRETVAETIKIAGWDK